MITILFFAQTRELIGVDSLTIDCDGISVSHLLDLLSQKGDKWYFALKEKTVLCAVNKHIVELDHLLHNGDEVAFFPPVTGG
ncbi:molybdopterin synthase sulfur carrier subunit [Orbaceae bacterium ac157xtp]